MTTIALEALQALLPQVQLAPVIDGDLPPQAGFKVASDVGNAHFIDLSEDGRWRILPGDAKTHLTVDAATRYVRALQVAIGAAAALNAVTAGAVS